MGLGQRRPARKSAGVSGLQTAKRGKKAANGGGDQGAILTIDGLAHDGRGVGRLGDGKTVFVDGALPGERVEIAVHRTRQRFDEAHVREVVEASPERVTPPCAHYGTCGGCDLQHLSLDGQRRHKQAVLRELLARQGIAPDGEPELLAEAGEGYRRRARLGVKVDADGRVLLGFRARHSHRLVDLDDCPILVPALAALLAPLHRHLAELEAPRQVGHLELSSSDAGVTLVIRQLREHDGDTRRWCEFALARGLHLARWVGRESPTFEWLTPAPDLHAHLAVDERSLRLGFAPGDFLQANEAVNQRMVTEALAWLSPLAPGERVLDLFAGVGNFSLPLAALGAEVTAVEGSPAMVERLADNARRNALELTARQADLSRAEALGTLLDVPGLRQVLLDPPRDGAEAVCRALAERPVPRVLYVSCDPATLARDAAHLVRAGYVIQRWAVADMFAHTAHLESMLLLEHPDAGQRGEGASSDG
ncbi:MULTISPECIES: TRAM domain-containing protein [Halomonas]|uniref:23S rRNA (uracil(1939)-C(5))-methyltransferase RlmD n=1 Tax=Halomonas halophila TaxID=29573 RepID=A0ABQ0U1W2_9GAMM|nr:MULTISPECIES: TRAM domain-containing protein [Halomonas]MDR5889449.1 TRAM domain-containing protein [Halomonas salina]WJY06133.1 TRAM domain-containing protein [Halomonas halophila]GEK72362.1 23S rRNA (uracil(1939)-C(5))-methyltransferase RlmD [Halomonas halophila]